MKTLSFVTLSARHRTQAKHFLTFHLPALLCNRYGFALAKTMTDFRTGESAPGMTDLMKAISESDIAALAAYLPGVQQ
jgi:cytochrome c553